MAKNSFRGFGRIVLKFHHRLRTLLEFAGRTTQGFEVLRIVAQDHLVAFVFANADFDCDVRVLACVEEPAKGLAAVR
jgi:hypothetical protein